MHRFAFLAAAALAGLLFAAPAAAHPHVWVTMKSEIVYAPDGSVAGVRHAWTFDDMFSTFAVQGLDEPEEKDKAAPQAKARAPSSPQGGGVWAWLKSTWAWITGGRSEPAVAETKPADAAPAPTEVVQAGPAELKPKETPAVKRLTRKQLQPLAEVNVTSLKEYDYFTRARVNGKKTAFVDPVEYYLEQSNDGLLTLHFLLPFAEPPQAKTLDLEVYDPSYFVDFAFDEKEPARLVNAPASCALNAKGPNEPQQPNVQRLPDAMANQPDTMNFGEQFASKISVKCQ